MSYRDDQDALLARADALEGDLARERARAAASEAVARAAEDRAAALERELGELRRRSRPDRPAPTPRPERSATARLGVSALLLVLIPTGLLLGLRHGAHHAYAPPVYEPPVPLYQPPVPLYQPPVPPAAAHAFTDERACEQDLLMGDPYPSAEMLAHAHLVCTTAHDLLVAPPAGARSADPPAPAPAPPRARAAGTTSRSQR